jgi:hypothetical protein
MLLTCAETFLYDPLVDWQRRKGDGPTQLAPGEAGEQENPQASSMLQVCWLRLLPLQ